MPQIHIRFISYGSVNQCKVFFHLVNKFNEHIRIKFFKLMKPNDQGIIASSIFFIQKHCLFLQTYLVKIEKADDNQSRNYIVQFLPL